MLGIDKDILKYVEAFPTAPSKEIERFRLEGELGSIPIILKDTENLLSWLLRIRRPKRILEIGTAVGYSACFMATLLKDAEIVTIEKSPQMVDRARNNIERLGFNERITIEEGDAYDCLDSLKERFLLGEFKPFDFVFIDAAKSHYREFWDYAITMTTDDATIVCDNILMRGKTASSKFDKFDKFRTSMRKMREFLDYITNLEHIPTTIMTVGDGVSISTKIKKEN